MLHTLRAEYSKIFAPDCLFFYSHLNTVSAQSVCSHLNIEAEMNLETRSQPHFLTLGSPVLVLYLWKLQMGSCKVEADIPCAPISPLTSLCRCRFPSSIFKPRCRLFLGQVLPCLLLKLGLHFLHFGGYGSGRGKVTSFSESSRVRMDKSLRKMCHSSRLCKEGSSDISVTNVKNELHFPIMNLS